MVAAIVKYNPCTRYARGGNDCLYFVGGFRRCGKPLGECDEPFYDKWYNDVLKGSMKSFYPFRIKLLENLGTFLLVYHDHIGGIVGEAKIVRYTVERDGYHYWFDEFIRYPRPVPLRIVYSDLRIPRLRGKWRVVYISGETLEEIRALSGLRGDLKERLRREAELLKEVLVRRKKVRGLFNLEIELDSFRRMGFDENVINISRGIFLRSNENPVTKRYPARRRLNASLLIALKRLRRIVEVDELVSLFKEDKSRLLRVYRILIRELNIKIPPVSPVQIIMSKIDELKLPDEIVRKTIFTIKKMQQTRKFIGCSPKSIAAAALYYTCKNENIHLTQSQTAKLFKVTEVSIRNILSRWLKDT